MSDNAAAPTPDSAPDSSPSPTPAAPKSARKPGRWRRRFTVALLLVVALVVVLRVILVIALPSVLRKVAGQYGLTCTYERSEIYIISGNVGLWHLRCAPTTGGPAVIDADYLRGDVSALNLLRGKLVVYHVEGDGIDFALDRDENGEIPMLKRLAASPAPKPAAPTTTAPAALAEADINLDPPLRIDLFRGTRVRVHVRDRAVTPPVDTTLDVNVRLADFGSLKRPTRFDLDATSLPLLDLLRVNGEWTARGKAMDAKMQVVVRGIHPRPAGGYLTALGLRPSGSSLSLDMTATVKTEPVDAAGAGGPTTRPTGLKGNITLSGISAVADNEEAAGVGTVAIGIDQLTPDRIKLGAVTIDDVRANAKRTSDGAIRVAGIDLVGAPTSAPPPPQAQLSAILPWSVGEVSIRNVKASFEDDAVTPAAKLALLVDHASVKNVASDGTELPTEIEVRMAVPGVARAVRIEGNAQPLAAKRSLDLKLVAEGVRPDAIRPYLDAAGIESQLNEGTFTCDLRASIATPAEGKVAADVQLGHIRFTDGPTELLALDGVTIAGAALDSAGNRMRVDSIDITGPSISAKREKSGVVGAAGFVLKPKPAAADATASAQPNHVALANLSPTTAPASDAMLAIDVGRVSWKGVNLRFDDAAVDPPTSIALVDTGVELNDIRIDFNPNAPAARQPGKIHAWLSAPGVAGRLDVTGTVAPAAGAVTTEVDVSGQNLVGGLLTPYLDAAGIKPELRDGSLNVHARVDVSRHDNELRADVALSGLSYADAGQELAGLDGLHISGAKLRPGAVEVGDVVIDKPRGRAMRDVDGALIVAGVRLLPAAPTTQPVVIASAAGAAPPPPTTLSAPQPTVITLRSLQINDANVAWIDRAVARPVDTSARATVRLDNLVVGRAADPAKLQVTLSVPDTLESLTASGDVSVASLDAPSAKLQIDANGIREGVLASYLPPNVRMNLADGRFHAILDAGVAPAAGGGQQARLIVNELDYRDGAQGQPLLHFDAAKLLASRIDPINGKVVAIDEVSLHGLETSLHRTADGKTQLLGLTISPAAPAPAAPPADALVAKLEAPMAQSGAGQPAAQQAAANIAPPPTTNVAELIAQERQPLPLITLDKLDVNLRRVSYTDDANPGAVPVALAGVNLHNRKRIELLGRESSSLPPTEIEVTGKVDPLVGSFTLVTAAAPFASSPTLVLDVDAAGINGDGLVQIAPALNETLDGSGLTDGRFKTHLEATAKFARRGPAQYDFGQPFDAEFTVRPLEFHSTPDGPPAAGVDEVHAEGIHVDPTKGNVAVRTLEITKPIGNVMRDADGIHALGFVLKPATQPTTQPDAPPQRSLADAPTSAAVELPAPTKPASEIRIDRLLVNGIDFRMEDRTTDPGLIVPLNNLDVEVRGLSNMAAYEDRPVRFNVVAGAGKVPLQDKSQRELFSEVAANGNLSLYPTTRGWVKSSVSGFEVMSLYGPANASGVKIGGGVFDGTVDLRFKDDGSLDTRSRFAFTDLKLSEPPNGPIQRTLKLPTPIDAVILVLQDPSGAITVPLNVPVKHGEVSTGSVVGSAAGAFASIVATAVASSPLKMAGGVGALLGMGGKEQPKGARPAGEVEFAAADAELSPAARSTIDALAERMRRDKKLELTLKHELGGSDLLRAAMLANPAPDVCAALAAQIRARKQTLLASRAELGAAARAQLASGAADDAARTIDELRAADRELSAVETALDRVYDLLRPGAERQADRRTRAAALDIGQDRLETVRAALLDAMNAAGVRDADQRLRVTHVQFSAPEQSDTAGRVTFTALDKKKP